MERDIITIDADLCNGCELCVSACHEGALQMIDGKAVLVSESYCDGLGDCLPECPTGAITIEKREADEFDKVAVEKHMAESAAAKEAAVVEPLPCGCPGSHSKTLERPAEAAAPAAAAAAAATESLSELRQWPVQIKLVPVNAPYFDGAKLLIAADCTAFANANVHSLFMKNKITLIGCPKLDDGDYAEKLTQIIANNNIKSVDVLRMSVPCCGGIEHSVKQALQDSGKMVPWSVTTIDTNGEILD
ncbi:MAG: 4Fe-4S dicluster domain-containing protein [Clostridia bacterium]|jgi:ferredoxin|nr:4Fe-4S dicluster domain-containing protein [Clostridia bacterium]